MNWYKIAQQEPSPFTAIDSIKSLGYMNPLNRNEVVIDDVKVSIATYDNETIWLKSIESIYPKQGKGTLVLQKIINIADQNNVSIYLDPMPFGKISSKNLISWYIKNGFVKGNGDFAHGLIHHPKSKK